jgi:hypothetical protein
MQLASSHSSQGLALVLSLLYILLHAIRQLTRHEENFILELRHQDEVVVDEDCKSQLVFNHFNVILGDFEEHAHGLDFDCLGLPTSKLSSIDSYFLENEVWSVISSMPLDKALGPDGFTAMFYQTAWHIIKHDAMQAFNTLWSLDFHSYYLVKQAYLVLLRKKPEAQEVKDFCPISLIHSFSKLVSKVLSARLAQHMNDLVQPNQSKFIKERAIHDKIYAHRHACILLKVDIAKAFDTIS